MPKKLTTIAAQEAPVAEPEEATETEPGAESETSAPASASTVSIDVPGVKCDRVSPGSDAERMLQALASQPKVRTRIPREAKEPIDAVASPIMNGLRINIRKGISVDLPEQVAKLIEDSYFQTEQATDAATVTNLMSGRTSNARIDLKSDAEQAAF